MSGYVDEKCRRIEQFAQYLRLMRVRRKSIAKRTCFAIFEESPPDGVDAWHIKESAATPVNFLANGSSDFWGESLPDIWTPDSTGNESYRYMQFAFHRDSVLLDMPHNTLFPNEAEQVLQQRCGFFYAKNRPDLWWIRSNWKDIVEWNPLQKVYLHDDEESAAEDMAFIMFQVWKFPVDWTWYVKAAVFGSDRKFERGKPLE
jgi:hypothetical protein